jgi:MtfA peptidase
VQALFLIPHKPLNIMSIVIIITALFVCFPALMLVYYIFYEPLRILFRVLFLNTAATLSREQTGFLEKSFPFYRQLSAENKVRFERRVAFFLRYKKFTGDDIEITGEMKLTIASCAIQLTFGLRNFWITDFDKIIILKESYSLANYDHKAMGDVSSGNGTITLSWKNVQEGVRNTSDGLNVGLHEMAHALMISSTEKGWNMSFASEYDRWEKDAKIDWYEKKEASEFFRPYAYTNLYEFFAVAVEYFFEKANEFSKNEPLLYTEMERLLRLDPLNTSDPILHSLPHVYPSQKIPLPQYSVTKLSKMIFASTRNFICFIIGCIATVFGIYLLTIALSFYQVHNYSDTERTRFGTTSGLVLAIAFFFYVQVFYNDKKSDGK